MRICIVNEFFYPDNTGGTGTVLAELARNLVDEHKDVSIDVITSTNLYRKSAKSLPAAETWEGIQIYRLPCAHPNGLAMPARLITNVGFTFSALWKLLRSGSYDVVLIGTAPPMIAAAASVFKALTQTPFVYIVYDLEPDRSVAMNVFKKSHPFVQFFQFGQKSWLKAASRIVVLGRCMRDHIANAYNLPPSKIVVIPIGANGSEITPQSRFGGFRAKHNITKFVVLYSGNFGRYHDFDTILDAARIIGTSNLGVEFVLVGGGAQSDHIKDRISDEKIANVRMFDFVDSEDYPDLLATADVSLVTLETGMEGLCVPSKFYSILASGRPVIAMLSECSEVAMVIEETGCGLRVSQGEPQGLVDALLWMIEHPEERLKMEVAARDALVTRFGTNIVAEQYYLTFLAACDKVKSHGETRPSFSKISTRRTSTALSNEAPPINHEQVSIESRETHKAPIIAP